MTEETLQSVLKDALDGKFDADAQRPSTAPCSTPLIDRLVDAAMEIAMFDQDWTDNSIPEVKYHRDLFAKRFSEIIGNRR